MSMLKVRKIDRPFTRQVLALALLLSIASSAVAQTEEDEEAERAADSGNVKPGALRDETDEDASSEIKPASSLRIEAGAPRPPAQTAGIAPTAAAPPGPPVIKVGGGFILAYFHPVGIKEDSRRLGLALRKPSMDTNRVALLLDSKLDRFGVHIEFRVRDKKFRNFYEGTAWIEETYGSFDLAKPGAPWGSVVLKVGKTYKQFGRFWDDSFIGNMQMRDGLKLDPNYGTSLEGEVGKNKKLGAKFFAQYFVMDGSTNSSFDGGRDTISAAAPMSSFPATVGTFAGVPRARRRNIFAARLEPALKFSDTTYLKVAGSIENFTADFGPTVDQQDVKRFAADATANVLWFGAWAEYTRQRGRSTMEFPFAARAATEGRAALPGASSDDVEYWLLGGRFFWKGMMLRYNYSSANYRDVRYYNGAAVDVKEWIHVPGVLISATQQLFLMIEFPIQKRTMPDVAKSPAAGAAPEMTDYLLDKEVIVTLHARI